MSCPYGQDRTMITHVHYLITKCEPGAHITNTKICTHNHACTHTCSHKAKQHKKQSLSAAVEWSRLPGNHGPPETTTTVTGHRTWNLAITRAMLNHCTAAVSHLHTHIHTDMEKHTHMQTTIYIKHKRMNFNCTEIDICPYCLKCILLLNTTDGRSFHCQHYQSYEGSQ